LYFVRKFKVRGNPKHKAQSTKYKVQNAKYKTLNRTNVH
jgi:hypothetical protein